MCLYIDELDVSKYDADNSSIHKDLWVASQSQEFGPSFFL